MNARAVGDIDWSCWRAVDPATLLFLLPPGRGEVLLIRKRRGLGAGKINGPGGRIEPGETPLQGALRETREEVGVVVPDAIRMGQLRFQFVDGYSLHVHVFLATQHRGEPVQTDEAIPMWVPLDAIPYDQMWADDRLWLPHLLGRRSFDGRFVFDGDDLLDHDLDVFTAATR